MKRKVIAVLSAIVLTITSVVVSPFNSMPSARAAEKLTSQSQVRSGGNAEPMAVSEWTDGEKSLENANRLVTVIVELEDTSLLEKYNEGSTSLRSEQGNSFNSYLQSSEADSITTDMLKQQDSVVHKITSTRKFGASSDVTYRYTKIMNGFAIQAKYSSIEKIKKLPGVKTAYEAVTYSRVEPVMSSSTKTIGATNLWDLDYKGEGTVVAILDTGLATDHTDFQTAPSQPKYTSAGDIQTLISNNPAGLQSAVSEASTTYVNSKIPYAYDYADKDSDVKPSEESIIQNGNEHGTHVAGTVAASEADGDDVTGVAPEAQLLIMKVFSDKVGDKGASDENILAALEDTVTLDADVINMSLGAPNGFSVEDTEETKSMNEAYTRIQEAGIAMAISAGNNYSSSYQNGLSGYSLSSNPDTAMVGSPSTYLTPLSVASVVNASYHSSYFEAGGRQITYKESTVGDQPVFSSLANDSSLEFVVVPGSGAAGDYSNLDVNGKIALVKRGSISFNEKLLNAKNHGARGIIVYNNQAGSISMSISDYDIPAVSITQEDGAYLIGLEDKSLKAFAELIVSPDAHANEPSLFSSWGVTPDLKLKPEIAAPGENIYSTLPGNTFGSMSGTSMAAPHIAGCYALMKEYLSKSYSSLTDSEEVERATNMLMSTAVPATLADGTPYSPRKQGSGIVNLYNAINAGAYLYTDKAGDANGRPKLNMGDDPANTGTFTKSFYVQSVTGSAITYTPKAVVLTEATADGVLGESPENITDNAEVSVSVNDVSVVSGSAIQCSAGTGVSVSGGSIIIEPNANAKIDITITLTEAEKAFLQQQFVNGEFIEGYITLDGEGVDLSIPYMGFYGDWTSAPVFDSGAADDLQGYQQTIHSLYGITTTQSDTGETSYGLTYLGVNPFDEYAYQLIGKYNPWLYPDLYKTYMPMADPNKIAISPNGDNQLDSLELADFSLLRNVKELNYEISYTDASGKKITVLSAEDENNKAYYVRKSTYSTDSAAVIPEELAIAYGGTNGTVQGEVLPNNTVLTFKVTGILDYSQHTQANSKDILEFPITIDTEKPVLKTVSADNNTLDFTVADNQYVAAVQLYTKTDTVNPVETIVINEAEKGKETSFHINKADYDKLEGVADSDLFVKIYDYALNESEYNIDQFITTVPTSTPTSTPVPTQAAAPINTPGTVVQPGYSGGDSGTVTTPAPTQTPAPTVAPVEEVTQNQNQVPVSIKVNDDKESIAIAVTIPKDKLETMLAEAIKNQTALEIPVSTESVINQIKNSNSNKVEVSLVLNDSLITGDQIPAVDIKVDALLLQAAAKGSKDVVVTVNNEKDELLYEWSFDGTELKQKQDKLKTANLSLAVTGIADNAQLSKVINDKDIPGTVLSFRQEGLLPAQAAVKVRLADVIPQITKDTKLYVYHYNEETGKLEALPYSSDYKVDKEGCLSIRINHCSDYVVLTKQPSAKVTVSLLEQVGVKASKTVLSAKSKTKTTIKLALPETLELVSSFDKKTTGQATGAVKVSYQSSNSKVVSVNSKGKLTAKGKGTAVITTTVTLYTKEKKIFKTTIKVKA